MFATISADVVHSTSLSQQETSSLHDYLLDFLHQMNQISKGSWGRVVRGDTLECVLEHPQDALRIALMIKCFLKSFEVKDKDVRFATIGARVAIGIGDLRINDSERGIIDGEAIWASGRTIDEKMTYSKGSLFLDCSSKKDAALQTIIQLCDTVVNKNTSKQCEVLYHKLCGLTEDEVAVKMGKTRPTINDHSMKAGWPAIESAIKYFENLDF